MGSFARSHDCQAFIEKVLPKTGIIPGCSIFEDVDGILPGSKITVVSIDAEEAPDERVRFRWVFHIDSNITFSLWGEEILFDPEDDSGENAARLREFLSCKVGNDDLEEMLDTM